MTDCLDAADHAGEDAGEDAGEADGSTKDDGDGDGDDGTNGDVSGGEAPPEDGQACLVCFLVVPSHLYTDHVTDCMDRAENAGGAFGIECVTARI